MSEKYIPRASIAFSITASEMDLPKVTEEVGQEPTHWYSPFAYDPKIFGWAFSNHEDGDNYCWQLRPGEVFNHQLNCNLIFDECERLADLLMSRADRIKNVCRHFSASTELQIFADFNDPQSMEINLGPKMMKLLAAIEGSLHVTVLNEFDPPK